MESGLKADEGLTRVLFDFLCGCGGGDGVAMVIERAQGCGPRARN